MAHEYKAEAKSLQEKKLKAYKSGEEGEAKNWAGFPALNTNKQAGLRPLNKDPELSKDTAEKIMRKKGGRVTGAASLKRLDKAPRKGKAAGGARVGMIPSPQTQQDEFDSQVRGIPGDMAPGTMRKHGGKIQDYEARSHESQGAQHLRPREGHKKGGSAYHEGHMSKGQKYGAARTSGETKGELDSAMRALKYGNKAKAEKELGRAQGHTRKTEYYTGRAKGGSTFEGSPRDEREDKKLEKKYHMTHKEWEASDLDKKHDKQESMKGLKKGGAAEKCWGGSAKKKGGRVHKEDGGPLGDFISHIGSFFTGDDNAAPQGKVVASDARPRPMVRKPAAPMARPRVAPVPPKRPAGLGTQTWADPGAIENKMRRAIPGAVSENVPLPPKRPAEFTRPRTDDESTGAFLRSQGIGDSGMKRGGRAKRADGGMLMGGADGSSDGKAAKKGSGKTQVNIMIGQPQPQGQNVPPMPPMTAGGMMPPPPPMGPPPGAGGPPPMGGAPGGMPPMGGMPPGGAPPMMPPGGPGGPPPGGMPPMMRKDGGSVQVPYRKATMKDGYLQTKFGNNGFGRREKSEAYGLGPTKSKNNY